VLNRVKLSAEATGGTLDDIVSMTVFLTDGRFYPAVNEVRREVFGPDLPTSTMVQVRADRIYKERGYLS